MFIVCVGLDFRTMPIELREQINFDKDELAEAHKALAAEKSILEDVIISTCERTEIYAVVDQVHTSRYYIKRFLSNWFKFDMDELADYLTLRTGEIAVRHLFELASGLDSPDVGEAQILGQVKNAFFIARQADTAGVLFNHLFQQVITFAKWTHSEYKINEHAETSTQAGIHQIKENLQDLSDKTLTVIGAGTMSQHALLNTSTMGFEKIILVNRTVSRAEHVADEIDAEIIVKPIDQLADILKTSDAVISAVSVKKPIFSTEWVQENQADLNEITFVDLGVPRNLSTFSQLDNCHYYDMDGLAKIVTDNHDEKMHLVNEVKKHIPDEIEDYFLWQKQLNVVPVIRQLREQAVDIQSNVYDSLLKKLPDLDDHEQKVIRKHMKSIVNQMLKEPIKEIKELSTSDDADQYLDVLKTIFKLDA
ncbi:glutamyl-tRNA reductase [Companilactobacillus sp.]|uniref:glutamyl-tRNA reductase n=1 Tax=Companilactobacillus sp. TaxID=2767905 RepID=UPI0025C40CF8|nr:glutamyl-tRNA reductase [Companilactobacillus sp.]MCH4008611.1 glutamyl-tRNA reductase [Companilactobacillus sp.]MCH4051210.1 glutamyl-tRNA reductase [Companilactobacillus sp.]MCH4076554.1 glutamyl-tRNA reductase [Companilactobacillus sp.]MCH4125129.1 glutamyl-tRNA reductase [Companilactobacillus sp.]MCH4131669.1 glutamyl-tRNA reductase [Companilactobacillus sp.]